ncbi:FecCD family ABC transporter permease [Pleomorphovibrio marinus]|uniref:FecCD family ABC transporter permease n=1 Tax=Pleomorphovibrio marinus TaxID=2164132 RepID=UPI000E0CB26B|nr:iron ABC transporter permease [Pleomorphovibrio marinus]
MLAISNKVSKNRLRVLVLASLGIGLMGVLMLSSTQGAYPIPMLQVVAILLDQVGIAIGQFDSQQANVFLQLRLPRILLAMLVGAGLGISGAALQGLFRNPLVEPGLIGVSSGGALFAVLYIVFGSYFPILARVAGNLGLPFFAFLGGLINVFLVYRLASQAGKTDIALLILAGVALNALCGALIGLSIFYADDAALRNFTFWSLGDVGGANWTKVGIGSLFIGLPALVLTSQHKQLNALAIGESEAFHLGVSVQKVKYMVLLLSALMVGVGVSMTGAIGFVGLVVPHLIRLLFGADHRLVLPASILLGALLLSFADLLARIIVMPAEMPIGIITAIIGSPFFIGLIMNVKTIKKA